MKEIVQAVLEFFTEFSWKRLRAFLFLLVIIIVFFFVLDSYTAYFTMSRLSRAADLISQIQSLETEKRSPELDQVYKALVAQVTDAVVAKPWTVRLNAPQIDVPYSPYWKFVASAAPWLFICLFMFRNLLRRKPDSGKAIFGCLVVALLFGLLALLVPKCLWPWFNLVVVPIALPVFVFGIGAYIATKFAAKPSAVQPAHNSSTPSGQQSS